MNIELIYGLVLTSSLVLLVNAVKSNNISIGLLHQPEHNLSQAVDLTISKLNSNKVRDFFLLLNSSFINASDAYDYKQKVCKMISQGVFVIMGAENATTERSMVAITETLHMPFISFSDQDLFDSSTNYKIRMAPSYISILADLETYYNWNYIFYLYNDQAGLARFEKFHDYFNDEEIEIDLRYLDHSLPNFYDVLRSLDSKYAHENEKRFNEKVLIVDLSTEELTQRLLDELVDVGMIRQNYHIVPATLSIRNLKLDRLKHGGVTVTGFQLNGLQETETIKQLVVDGLNLTSKALNNSAFKSVYQRGKAGQPGNCELTGNLWKYGPSIMQSLIKTSFNGATGLVRFDKDGYRKDFTFELLQMTRSKSLTKVGSWSSQNGLRALENIRPKKKSKTKEIGYYNETFIITTILVQPYASYKKPTEGAILKGNDMFEGYAIDLVHKLAEIIGFNFTIKPVADGKHGSQLPNGSWDGMVGELISGRADMAVGDLTIQSVRERVVDFSTPFMNLGISIMIKRPEKQKPSVFSFMEPLSNEVWIFMAISFIGVSTIIYVTARLSPAEWRVETGPDGEDDVDNDFTAQNSAWFVAGAIMCQGSDLSPVAPSGRVVGSAWWFFSLIVISSYTANLAAFLTVENIVIPINDVSELANSTTIKFGTLASGTTRGFFENSTIKIFQDMWKKMASEPSLLMPNVEEGINRVRNSKGKYAFLFESTTNEYANQRKPCNTMKVGENLDSKNYGVATPRGHKLRHQVTMAILRLHETGELNKLKQIWWYDKGQCSSDSSGSSIKALSLSNVAGVFYILIGGLLIAMVSALCEFLIKSMKDAKKHKKSFRDSMKSKAKLSIAGESDDSPFVFLPRPSYKISIEPPK